jgi:hypothetical protein
MPHSRDRQVASVDAADRRCPVTLALCAGAYLCVGHVADRRSVRRLPGPFPAVAAPVSTSHRVSLPTCAGYSSRSQPVIRDEAATLGLVRWRVKRSVTVPRAVSGRPRSATGVRSPNRPPVCPAGNSLLRARGCVLRLEKGSDRKHRFPRRWKGQGPSQHVWAGPPGGAASAPASEGVEVMPMAAYQHALARSVRADEGVPSDAHGRIPRSCQISLGYPRPSRQAAVMVRCPAPTSDFRRVARGRRRPKARTHADTPRTQRRAVAPIPHSGRVPGPGTSPFVVRRIAEVTS